MVLPRESHKRCYCCYRRRLAYPVAGQDSRLAAGAVHSTDRIRPEMEEEDCYIHMVLRSVGVVANPPEVRNPDYCRIAGRILDILAEGRAAVSSRVGSHSHCAVAPHRILDRDIVTYWCVGAFVRLRCPRAR